MERRWGSDLRVRCAADSSWSRAVVAALVEQRLSPVPKVQPACAAEADRAEATVAPLRDLHGRGERFEEVKMERQVATGEGTVASLPSGRSPANAVTRSSWFRWRAYS